MKVPVISDLNFPSPILFGFLKHLSPTLNKEQDAFLLPAFCDFQDCLCWSSGSARAQSLLGFLAAQNRVKSKWGHFPVEALEAAGPGTPGVSSTKGDGEGEVWLLEDSIWTEKVNLWSHFLQLSSLVFLTLCLLPAFLTAPCLQPWAPAVGREEAAWCQSQHFLLFPYLKPCLSQFLTEGSGLLTCTAVSH